MDIFFVPELHMGDPALEYRFFTIFSVFEYALKATGYVRFSHWEGVKADWESFIEDIENDFDWHKSPSLEEAVQYLFDEPPRRQVFNDGHLEWGQNRRPLEAGDIEWLLRLVKTVRNNLFHGGKKPFDPDRDTRLLKSSIQVLIAWAELKPEFKKVILETNQVILEKVNLKHL